MSDLTAGPPPGERDGDAGPGMNGPPAVLIAALGAALLIAVGVIAAFSSLGGDDSGPADSDRAVDTTRTTADKRVLLTVSVGGTGIGTVQLTRSDVDCNASCEYKFTAGARVTASAEAASGSTFEGWGGACSGETCEIVMDRPRRLTATFTAEPTAAPVCEGVPAEERDPECPPADTTTTPVEPGPECSDGIDNDDDGLTDSAQDPDCDTSGSESGAPPAPITPPPSASPPATGTADCADGKDNDHDGLTDTAQDPDCADGHSESGAPVRAPRGGRRSRSECSDGRDNDGDGLIDTAQDPGCEANSTEAG